MSMIMAAMVFLTIGTGYVQAQDKTSDSASELPKVYLIKEITPENLVKIYEALGRKAEGIRTSCHQNQYRRTGRT